jgi:hypothetical protein
MITSDLVIYIKKQISKNLPKELITSRLIQNGWLIDDVNEAFLKAEEDMPKREVAPEPVFIKEEIIEKPKDFSFETKTEIKEPIQNIKQPDPYREIPENSDNLKENVAESINKLEAESFLDKKEVASPTLENKSEDIDGGMKLSAASFSSNKKSFADFKNNISGFNPIIPIKQGEAPVIAKTEESKIEEPLKTENPKVESSQPLSAPVPTLESNPNHISNDSVPNWVLPKKNLNEKQNPVLNSSVESSALGFKSAIISSYRTDVDSINNAKNENINNNENPKSKKSLKVLAIILVIFLLGGGISFAFLQGYIELPFSFIKKDPKLVLVDFRNDLRDLDSYKVDSEIILSSPLLADITSGLYNGEAINSTDRDTVSVLSSGLVVNNDALLPSSKYDTVFSSSLIKEKIKFNVIYNGYNIFTKIPNLSSLLGESFSVEENTVSIPKEKLSLLNSELPESIKSSFMSFDVFGVFSKFISSGEEDKFSIPFKKFIESSSVVDKGEESIHGSSSYHYEIVVDRENTKNLVTALINNFGGSINTESKDILKNNAGFVYVDSFEIWVNKKNNILSQYRVVLSMPLSKVLQLDDKGVGDNKVNIEIRNAFYDFDKDGGEISTPKIFIQVEDYLKLIKDSKISSILKSLDANAKSLKNSQGSFGKGVNKESCLSPVSASLFSPLGHLPSSSSTVGDIAENMKNLLAITGDKGVCMSNANEWMVAVPLNKNNLVLCIDSSGNKKNLETYPTGSSCVEKQPESIVENPTKQENANATGSSTSATSTTPVGPLRASTSTANPVKN